MGEGGNHEVCPNFVPLKQKSEFTRVAPVQIKSCATNFHLEGQVKTYILSFFNICSWGTLKMYIN